MGRAIGVLLVTRLKLRLSQCTIDESVFRIHDSRLRVCQCLLINTGGSLVTLHEDCLAVLPSLLLHEVLDVRVVLQEFQGDITGGIAGMNGRVWLQELLNMMDAVFYLMSVVDMDMACRCIDTLIHLDDCLEQLFNTHAALEGGRHHRSLHDTQTHRTYSGRTPSAGPCPTTVSSGRGYAQDSTSR